MKEIVNKLQENRQIELAKRILESEGYDVKLVESDDIDRYDESEIIREGCALGHDSSEVWIRTGRHYHLTFSLKTGDDTVYESLKPIFEKSIGEALEYCMRRNFTVSYEGTVLD